jgi:hypothetical protein
MDRFPMKMMMAVGLVVALLAPLPALAQAIRADLLPLPSPAGSAGAAIILDPALCSFFVTVINAGLLEAGPFAVRVFYDTGEGTTQPVGGLAPARPPWSRSRERVAVRIVASGSASTSITRTRCRRATSRTTRRPGTASVVVSDGGIAAHYPPPAKRRWLPLAHQYRHKTSRIARLGGAAEFCTQRLDRSA